VGSDPTLDAIREWAAVSADDTALRCWMCGGPGSSRGIYPLNQDGGLVCLRCEVGWMPIAWQKPKEALARRRRAMRMSFADLTANGHLVEHRFTDHGATHRPSPA
jgi:hypothetical protein